MIFQDRDVYFRIPVVATRAYFAHLRSNHTDLAYQSSPSSWPAVDRAAPTSQWTLLIRTLPLKKSRYTIEDVFREM